MHRTKCGNVVKKVISPCMLSELVEDIGDSKYSLIVDESTDTGVCKYLCMCVKYFSRSKNKMITDYLGIILLESATADLVYEGVTKYLEEIGLKISNIIGLGTDGGTNLCAKYNSLYAYLKKRNPAIQLNRCVCHSVDNCASKASEEFPASVDFLLKEIYNWFCQSAKRRAEYRHLFDIFNANDSENSSDAGESKRFHQFVQLSSTRWLARYNCILTVLEHWFELKTHFSCVVKKEKCYSARLLNDMLQDNSNYLYLKLVKPILSEVQRINLLFQRDDVDLCRLFDDLSGLVMLFAKKILKPSFYDGGIFVVLNEFENELAYKSISEMDFGIEFKKALDLYPVDNMKKKTKSLKEGLTI